MDVSSYASALSGAIYQAFGQLWSILTHIVTPIAAIILAGCGAAVLLGKEQDLERAKRTAVRIIIGVAIVYIAPQIVGFIANGLGFSITSWAGVAGY